MRFAGLRGGVMSSRLASKIARNLPPYRRSRASGRRLKPPAPCPRSDLYNSPMPFNTQVRQLLLFTGLYMFALPYLVKRRSE